MKIAIAVERFNIFLKICLKNVHDIQMKWRKFDGTDGNTAEHKVMPDSTSAKRRVNVTLNSNRMISRKM